MIGCFPDAYPDELFYSICARYANRVHYPSPKLVMRELFDVPAMSALIDFPTNLEKFLSKLPPGHGYTVDQLIDAHTVYPFYAPFLPQERSQQMRKAMREVAGDAYSIARVLGLRVKPIRLRSCLQCFIEDREKFGEAYWHRVHQIPGVEICPIHQLVLSQSWDEGKSALLSAEGAAKYPIPYAEQVQAYRQVFLQLANDSIWLLGQQNIGPGLEALRHRFKMLLAEQSAIPAVVFRWDDPWVNLLQRFKDCFPSELLQLLHPKVHDTPEVWLPHMFHPYHAQHPLRHLLLVQFLGCTAAAFFCLPNPEKPFGEGPWPCLNPASDYYGTLQIYEYQVIPDDNHWEWWGRVKGRFSCSCGYVYSRISPGESSNTRYWGKVESYGPVWEAAYEQLMSDRTLSNQERQARLATLLARVEMHY